jgi:hypothetical protein
MPGSALTIIKGNDIISTVADLEHVESALKSERTGQYVIEESSIAGELLPSGYSCQRCGIAFREADGAITLEREIWARPRLR